MAEQLLSRIGLFIERADLLEANINTLQKNYGEMRRSLDGRMGIVQKANEMKSLGVKEDAKHRIPNLRREQIIFLLKYLLFFWKYTIFAPEKQQ